MELNYFRIDVKWELPSMMEFHVVAMFVRLLSGSVTRRIDAEWGLIHCRFIGNLGLSDHSSKARKARSPIRGSLKIRPEHAAHDTQGKLVP